MGLIRSSARATAVGSNLFSGTITLFGAPTHWQAINDPFGPGTIRASSGAGYSDDLTDDTDYVRIGSSLAFIEFVFDNGDLYFNGDDVALAINIRARTVTSSATPETITLFRDLSDIAPDFAILGTTTIPADTAWHDIKFVVLNNPQTGLPWAMADFTTFPATTFGVRAAPLLGVAFDISRMYLTTLTFPGPTVGLDYRQSNWRFCDVCGLKRPYEQIQRPSPPHPQAGLAVCARCYDEPDHDTVKVMSRHLPRDYDDTLY